MSEPIDYADWHSDTVRLSSEVSSYLKAWERVGEFKVSSVRVDNPFLPFNQYRLPQIVFSLDGVPGRLHLVPKDLASTRGRDNVKGVIALVYGARSTYFCRVGRKWYVEVGQHLLDLTETSFKAACESLLDTHPVEASSVSSPPLSCEYERIQFWEVFFKRESPDIVHEAARIVALREKRIADQEVLINELRAGAKEEEKSWLEAMDAHKATISELAAQEEIIKGLRKELEAVSPQPKPRVRDYAFGSKVWPGLAKLVEEMGELGEVLVPMVCEVWGADDCNELLAEGWEICHMEYVKDAYYDGKYETSEDKVLYVLRRGREKA